jgi:hypothetical protein
MLWEIAMSKEDLPIVECAGDDQDLSKPVADRLFNLKRPTKWLYDQGNILCQLFLSGTVGMPDDHSVNFSISQNRPCRPGGRGVPIISKKGFLANEDSIKARAEGPWTKVDGYFCKGERATAERLDWEDFRSKVMSFYKGMNKRVREINKRHKKLKEV